MQCVTIFSTGRIFRLVLNVMQLHALTQVAHPYAVVDLSSTFPVTVLTMKTVLLCRMKCRGRSHISRRIMSIARMDKNRISSKLCIWVRNEGMGMKGGGGEDGGGWVKRED